MEKTVVALYDALDAAQAAVHELIDNGVGRDDVSVVRTNQQGDYTTGNLVDADESDAGGAAAGAGIGAVLGGLAGLLVGLGALAIPGIGPVIAAGPLATTLAGAGLGAATGGLVGALADAGVPENEAGRYAEGVRRGGTLVTVRAEEDQVTPTSEILRRFSPIDVNQRAGEWGVTHTASNGVLTSQVGERNARLEDKSDYRTSRGMTGENSGGTYEGTGSAGYTGPGTTYEGAGSYTSDIERSHTPDLSVPPDQVGSSNWQDEDSMLSSGHGEMSTSTGLSGQGGGTYERMQAVDPSVHPRSAEGDYQARRDILDAAERDRNAGSGDMIQTGRGSYDSQGQNFEPAEGDRWQGSSQGHAMGGQLGGHQGALAGGESFTGPASGDDMGTAAMTFRSGPATSESAHRVEDYEPDFRNDWDNNHRSSGFGYERYRPAYRYGWQLGERYPGRDWNDFAGTARADWEQSHPDDAWQDFDPAIRYGWNQYREGARMSGTQIAGAQAPRSQTYGAESDAYRARAAKGDRSGGQEFGHQQVDYGYDRMMGEMSRRFEAYDRDFRSDWDRSFRSTGYGYERYQPAYQYGYNLATDAKYRGREWSDIEADARRDWETRHPNDAWEDFKDAIQHAWDRVRSNINDALD